jgi:formate dehydrogenase major subunit
MLTGGSTPIASEYYQVRLGGDMAAVRGMAKAVFAADDAALAAGNPSVLDRNFIDQHTTGFDLYRAAVEATTWDEIEDQSGLSRGELEALAQIYIGAERTICTWAMGVTQHRHSVAMIREIASFMFLRGNVGHPGTGLCPVRGHSNVQGDRTVGINEKPSHEFLDALENEFGVPMPRHHGHNVLAAIGAMLDGTAQAFIGLGGNFARATPDTSLIAKALAKQKLTVNIATKLNYSHLLPGEVSYVLPCLGRTEIDRNSDGIAQIVTVEDSMCMVHGSGGINRPASPELRSEVSIIAGIAEATLGSKTVDWKALAHHHDRIRDLIGRTIPGFHDYNTRVRKPRGFRLYNAVEHRVWNTPSRRATFSHPPLPEQTEHQRAAGEPGLFVLQTFRSHDQYNTTVYGLDDRYRGIYGERQIVFINPADLAEIGAQSGDRVDIIGQHKDGVERIARSFRVVPYDVPRGSVAGYYPELNVLVPLSSAGEQSDTPTSKSILVSFRQTAQTLVA